MSTAQHQLPVEKEEAKESGKDQAGSSVAVGTHRGVTVFQDPDPTRLQEWSGRTWCTHHRDEGPDPEAIRHHLDADVIRALVVLHQSAADVVMNADVVVQNETLQYVPMIHMHNNDRSTLCPGENQQMKSSFRTAILSLRSRLPIHEEIQAMSQVKNLRPNNQEMRISSLIL